MRGDPIKSLLYMPGGHSMTIIFLINMLGGPIKSPINMPSGHQKYESVGTGSGSAALARWLWLGGSGSGCNPDRVISGFGLGYIRFWSYNSNMLGGPIGSPINMPMSNPHARWINRIPNQHVRSHLFRTPLRFLAIWSIT